MGAPNFLMRVSGPLFPYFSGKTWRRGMVVSKRHTSVWSVLQLCVLDMFTMFMMSRCHVWSGIVDQFLLVNERDLALTSSAKLLFFRELADSRHAVIVYTSNNVFDNEQKVKIIYCQINQRKRYLFYNIFALHLIRSSTCCIFTTKFISERNRKAFWNVFLL